MADYGIEDGDEIEALVDCESAGREGQLHTNNGEGTSHWLTIRSRMLAFSIF